MLFKNRRPFNDSFDEGSKDDVVFPFSVFISSNEFFETP